MYCASIAPLEPLQGVPHVGNRGIRSVPIRLPGTAPSAEVASSESHMVVAVVESEPSTHSGRISLDELANDGPLRGGVSLDSPRSIKACAALGISLSDLEIKSAEYFEQLGVAAGDIARHVERAAATREELLRALCELRRSFQLQRSPGAAPVRGCSEAGPAASGQIYRRNVATLQRAHDLAANRAADLRVSAAQAEARAGRRALSLLQSQRRDSETSARRRDEVLDNAYRRRQTLRAQSYLR
jgi:hypothetical protein